MKRILIAAGGTGGHIFPALAVARVLKERGVDVHWLGAKDGMEVKLVHEDFPINLVPISGLRGKGLKCWLMMPFKLLKAIRTTREIIKIVQPSEVLVMGGFVSGPAGIAAKMMKIPLYVHEQNTVPGLTNKWLARHAVKVMQAFPNTFKKRVQAMTVGNPLRAPFFEQKAPERRFAGRKSGLRVFVLGGSRGARFLNQNIPSLVALLSQHVKVEVIHQTGGSEKETVIEAYESRGVKADVKAFIEETAEAMAWADIVIARAGALSVSEIAAVGVGALLVPFPSAVDDHQTKNARFLANHNAAVILKQADYSEEAAFQKLLAFTQNREHLLQMAESAHALAQGNSTERVIEVLAGQPIN